IGRPRASRRLLRCRGCGVVFFCNSQCQKNNSVRDNGDPEAHCDKPICDQLIAVQWFTRKDWRLMRWSMEEEESREPLLFEAWGGNDQVPSVQHFRVATERTYCAYDNHEPLYTDQFEPVIGYPPASLF